MSNLEIAIYTREDNEVFIYRTLNKARSWSEFNPPSWDSWLKTKDDRLLIVSLDSKQVALAHISINFQLESWLEGLRVAPSFRGIRIAFYLFKYSVDVSKQLGALVMRFAAKDDRKAYARITERFDFHQICSFFLGWAPCENRYSNLTLATPKDILELWDIACEANNGVSQNIFYAHDWKFQALSYNRLQYHIHTKEVLVYKNVHKIKAFAICALAHQGKQQLIGFVSGIDESIYEIATYLRYHHYNIANDNIINVALPFYSSLLPKFINAGYKPYFDAPFTVYECNLNL